MPAGEFDDYFNTITQYEVKTILVGMYNMYEALLVYTAVVGYV